MKVSRSGEPHTGVIQFTPELRFTSFGRPLLTFIIRVGESDESWEIWDAMAEEMCEILKLGMTVTVTGRSRVHSWEDRDGRSHSRTVWTASNCTVQ